MTIGPTEPHEPTARVPVRTQETVFYGDRIGSDTARPAARSAGALAGLPGWSGEVA